MKKTFWIASLLLAVAVFAAPDRTTTNYFPNYKQTTAAFTNAGDSGLVTGKVYFCFSLDDLAQSTTNAENDVANLINGILARYVVANGALADTNQPAQFTITVEVRASSSTNVATFYRVEVNRDISTFTYTSE